MPNHSILQLAFSSIKKSAGKIPWSSNIKIAFSIYDSIQRQQIRFQAQAFEILLFLFVSINLNYVDFYISVHQLSIPHEQLKMHIYSFWLSRMCARCVRVNDMCKSVTNKWHKIIAIQSSPWNYAFRGINESGMVCFEDDEQFNGKWKRSFRGFVIIKMGKELS